MRKFICYFLFIVGVTFSGSAQNIDQYRYVKVPEKFDFLKEENQYQLNALAAFLFEKYGFEVFYKKEVPQEVEPCEVLQAKVNNESNLFRSKLSISLENCRDEIIFTSQIGTSGEKDYKASYHEALREAFASVEKLNHKFIASKNNPPSENKTSNELPKEVIVDPVITAEEVEKETSLERKVESDENIKNQYFKNGAVTYSLKKSPEGYELFREGEAEKFASLIKSGRGDNYLFASKNTSGNAFFDTGGNLVVEYVDPNSRQLVTVNYKLQAQ